MSAYILAGKVLATLRKVSTIVCLLIENVFCGVVILQATRRIAVLENELEKIEERAENAERSVNNTQQTNLSSS